MHPSNGDGVAGEVHDELTVTVDADDVAFETGKKTGEDAETNVVASEFFKRITQEGDCLGMGGDYFHEGTHHTVGDGGWTTCAAVVD